MALLLSRTTASRLVSLLDRQGPGALKPLPAVRTVPRPESESDYPAPFAVRYSVAAASWIIHLPPRCCTWVESEDTAVALTAVTDLPGWYLFDGAAGGIVYAWVQPASEDPERWWGSWARARLAIGMTLPPGAAEAGAFVPVAHIDVSTYRVRQYVRSTLRLTDVPPDSASLHYAYDADGYPRTQLYEFDTDEAVTELGLAECITADPDTGEILVNTRADKYQLVVRVVNGDNHLIGYMPLWMGDGDDPDESADPTSECAHEDHPGTPEDPEEVYGIPLTYIRYHSGITYGDRESNGPDRHPGKQGACW
jgi:hypothetical protein